MIQLHSTRFPNSFYRKTGNGFPIILAHGFGETGEIFKHQIEYLKNSYMVIVPDLPGSGQSAFPNEHMSMNLLADFMVEIMNAETIEKTVILGHSMGGYLTLAMAEKYPERLIGFGLIHSSAFADSEEKKENRRKSIALLSNHESGKEVFLKAMIPNLYSEKSKKQMEEEIQIHLTSAMQIPSYTLIAYYQAMIDRPDRTEVLRTFKKPILFILGTEDNAVPLNQGLELCKLPAIAKVCILEEVGHTGMIESVKVVNETIESFISYLLSIKNK